MRIQIDHPVRPDLLALLEENLRKMHVLSPPESVHALDLDDTWQDLSRLLANEV